MNKANTEPEVFNRYELVDSLDEVNIIHLYDTNILCSENDTGYNDARHFTLKTFNTKTNQRAIETKHYDGIDILDSDVEVNMIRIYEDGSTMIRFKNPVSIQHFQSLVIRPCKK